MWGFDPISLSTAAILVGMTGCDSHDSPRIETITERAPIKYNNLLSSHQLENFKIDTVSPYAAHEHAKVGGLMGGKINISTDINIAWSTNKFLKRSCFWFDDIKVILKTEPTIYIAREYRKGSCKYDKTMEHEMRHVKEDLAIIKKYKPKFNAAVKKAVYSSGTIGPIPASNENTTRQDMMKIIDKAINQVLDKMHKERRERQQAIDSRKEYDRLSKVCHKKR